MLRLAFRTNVHELQLSNPLSRVIRKPGYYLFYIILLTASGEDQHGLLHFSRLRPFRLSTRKLHLTSPY
jgi:hypothetical protein